MLVQPFTLRVENRRFKFHKSSQFFLRVHNEMLSVAAICVCNPDVRPLESIAETQPKLRALSLLPRELEVAQRQ